MSTALSTQAGPWQSALARARSIETLEAAYGALDELRQAHAAFCAGVAAERRKLSEHGDFLLGSIRAAAAEAPPGQDEGLVKSGGLDRLIAEADAELARKREALEARAARDEAEQLAALAELEREIAARAERYLAQAPPSLALSVHPAGGKRVLHLSRLSGDAPVLLCFALTGKVPSRYDFLLDDATDDVALPPPPLYPDGGLAPDALRPDANGLRARVVEARTMLPVKGFIPLILKTAAGEEFYRLLQRGPVIEIERQAGAAFESLLDKDTAERFAGHLLRLKLSGRITLEIDAA